MSRHHDRRHGKFRFAHPADSGNRHDTSSFATTNTDTNEDDHGDDSGDH